MLLAVSFVFESGHTEVLKTASAGAWAALAYTVVFGSIIAHTGMYFLLQRYPLKLVTPFNLLSPVFAVLGGILFLDDEMTIVLVLGGILVLAGVGWIYLRSGRNALPDAKGTG